MAELNDIINLRIPVNFDFHGTPINIAYRPYSTEIEQRVKGDGAWESKSMNQLVAKVLIDWDLTQQGKPLPITEESLSKLPTLLQLYLFYAVQNDLREGKLPSVNSGATSQQAE